MSRGSTATLNAGRSRSAPVLRILEWLLLLCGLTGVGLFLAARIDRTVASSAELQRFWDLRDASPPPTASAAAAAAPVNPDFRLWSPQRVSAYRSSAAADSSATLGVLRIPSVELEAPILEGTDALTLNRGVGHIGGTAGLGEDGNIGIAGHRDGFFRALKDVRNGDIIDVWTLGSRARYTVDEMRVVSPDDVSVLLPQARPTLTLVTCYPFYFLGSAPERYIVHASIMSSDRREDDPAVNSKVRSRIDARGDPAPASDPATQNASRQGGPP